MVMTDETIRLREAIRQGAYPYPKQGEGHGAQYNQAVARVYELERAAEAAAGDSVPVPIPAAR